MRFPERDHLFEETKNVLIRLELAPVKPADFVVLVVRIVVAELRVQEVSSFSVSQQVLARGHLVVRDWPCGRFVPRFTESGILCARRISGR